MKGKFTLLFLLLFSGSFANGQTTAWAIGFGGNQTDTPEDIVSDASGNTYLVGNYQDSLFLPGDTLLTAGNSDFFVASFDPGGGLRWARSFGGPSTDLARTLELDGNGNLYIGGEFLDSTIIETDTFYTTNAISNFDLFILRLDLTGAYDTLFSVDSTGGGDFVSDLAADAAGNLVVTGRFRGTAAFGTDTLKAAAYDDLFLAKMSPTGVWLWARQTEGKLYENGVSVDIMGDTAYYVAGSFQDTTWFNDSAFYRVSSGEEDLILLKYSSNGTFRFAENGGGAGSDYPTAMEIVTDKLFIGASFEDTLTFGGSTVVSHGDYDALFMRCDAGGSPLWMVAGGGLNFDGVNDLAVSAQGINVTGFFQGYADFGTFHLESTDSLNSEAFIAQLDLNGVFNWFRRGIGPSSDEGNCIAVSPGDFVIASGQFIDSIRFGPVGLNAEGGLNDVFLTQFTPTGGVNIEPQIAQIPNLKVFPNPSNGEITISWNSMESNISSIQLLDLSGTMLFDRKMNENESSIDADFGQLPAGLYLIRLCSDQGIFTARWAIIR